MAYTGAGQAERVTAGWAASNPATPGGPAAYTYGSGLVSASDNAGTANYTRDPSGTLVSQRLPGGVTYYYVFDGEGSVVMLVDPPSGVPVSRCDPCPTSNQAGDRWQPLGRYADGAAVGSALVTVVEETPRERREEAAERFVRALAGGATSSLAR